MKTLRNDILRKFAPIATILLVGLLCGSAALAGTVDACAVLGGGALTATNTVFPPARAPDTAAAMTLRPALVAAYQTAASKPLAAVRERPLAPPTGVIGIVTGPPVGERAVQPLRAGAGSMLTGGVTGQGGYSECRRAGGYGNRWLHRR